MSGLFGVWVFAALEVSAAVPAAALDVGGFEPDRTAVYKSLGDRALELHVFNPPGHAPSDRRPVIVFFFGGGWHSGSPSQFYPHCRYLASRGMVACSAQYRVKSRDGTTPRDCVEDGKSAVRWLRENSDELGIDPARVVAGGGSAGGHVAAATGTVDGLEGEGENLGVSSRPEALVLFNPVFDNGPGGFGHERVAEYWESISPMHNISEAAPPTVAFFGTEDDLVPVATAEEYAGRMEAAGRRCDLHLYEGQGHGFFNYEHRDYFATTVQVVDAFLVSLGFLQQDPDAVELLEEVMQRIEPDPSHGEPELDGLLPRGLSGGHGDRTGA